MYHIRMLRAALALWMSTLCANSLSVMSFNNVFMVSFPDESNSILEIEDPPPHVQVAKMARYVVHNSDWAVLAYKSQHPQSEEFPMGTILSFSDGPVEKSKGTPYVYVSRVEDAVQDMEVDSRCSLTISLAQGSYCKQKKLDPQFPTCAQVTLTGRFAKVNNGTAEQDFAKQALFSRHPSMKTWPEDHHFFFMKLNIERVIVQDYFGGPIYVSVADYYKATPQ